MNFSIIQAQDLSEFVKGKTYVIDTITVKGLKTFSNQTVVSYSGLRKGQKVSIPGDEISAVISKLWGLQLFSDINFYITKVEGENVSLEIEIDELPTLTNVKINGIKKGKIETIIDETELTKGKKLSESFLTNTRNYIINKYKKENPGSKLKTAVTGDVKPGSKDAKRRKSFCARSKGWTGERGKAARRRWKC